MVFFFLSTGWISPLRIQSSANRSRWLLLAELLSVCCSFSALPQFQSPESIYRACCHVGGTQSDYNENNIPCPPHSSDVDDVPQTFQMLPATAWCPSGMYLQPNQPLWHFQNKVITHHLPPSATKTRGHAVQASC